jgi:hypothetical protein
VREEEEEEEEEDEQLLRKSGPKRRLPVLGCCRALCPRFGQLLLTARVATSFLSLSHQIESKSPGNLAASQISKAAVGTVF